MKTSAWISSACCVMLLSIAKANAQTINFDNLSHGSINGQDGWTSIAGSPSVVTGTGVDVTNVISGGIVAVRNRGLTPTAQNSSIWQFDSNLNGGAFASSFYELGDSTGTGAIAFGLNVPGNGALSGVSSFNLDLRSSAYNGVSHYVGAPIAGGTASDWYRIKLVLDLAANGGDGAGSMFEEDLTAGDTAFSAISGLQNINLGLTDPALSGLQVGNWTHHILYVTGGGSLDNLSAEGAVEATPEPASIQLIGAGLLACGLIRRRRSK